MIVLKPENPKYEDLIFTGQELSEIRILGKARCLSEQPAVTQVHIANGQLQLSIIGGPAPDGCGPFLKL